MSIRFVESAAQDLRYSWRALVTHPLFAGLSVLCLALAIGTNTTVFTIVNGLLLRPLPLAGADRLAAVQEVRLDDTRDGGPVSYANFAEASAQAKDVAQLAASRSTGVRIADAAGTDGYAGAFVSGGFFDVLGVRPAHGRALTADDDRPGAPAVAVISHALWQQRYNADAGILGRSITVNEVPRTIVGVMPAELSRLGVPSVLRVPRVWLPLAPADHAARRDQRRLSVYARLNDGVALAAASARLQAVARGLEEAYPENRGWGMTLEPLQIGFSANTQRMLLTMMGAVSFVLLIACANVANLTLARATERRHEIATRLALGASRVRIVRQVLTESLLIAIASVPAGVLLAYWGRGFLLGANASPDVVATMAIDTRLLLFTILLAVVASALSGFLPAFHAVRRLNALQAGARRDGASAPPHTRLSYALIVGEVALAVILLVGASLFVQSFRNLLSADGGFDTSRILTARVEMVEEDAEVTDAVAHRVTELAERLAATPAATAAAAATLLPLRDAGERTPVITDGPPRTQPPVVMVGGVTAGFFDVLGVPIVKGRAFTETEGRSRSAVAIVNRRMASRLWPNEEAIGRRFRRAADPEGPWFTIVGISDDILSWDISDRPLATAYVPYLYVPLRDPRVFVRTAGDPLLAAGPARAAIQSFDARLAVDDVRTMADVHALGLARNRTLARLFVVLGAIALLLAAAGVYGVLSYHVTQRTHEIGIRAALGAGRSALVALFVKRGLYAAIAGVVLGIAGASALTRLIRSRLHEVSPTDPLTFAGVPIVLIAVAVLATYLPARRAAAVDPLIAIRE